MQQTRTNHKTTPLHHEVTSQFRWAARKTRASAARRANLPLSRDRSRHGGAQAFCRLRSYLSSTLSRIFSGRMSRSGAVGSP